MLQFLTGVSLMQSWCRCLALGVLVSLAAGCAAPPQTTADPRALLLVSLADGSIVGQRINAAADICMKANDSPATTCLTRGTPLLDTTGQAVIGYQMEQIEIELVSL